MNLGKKLILIIGGLLGLLGLGYIIYTTVMDRKVNKEPEAFENGTPIISSEGKTGEERATELYSQFDKLYSLDGELVGLLADAASSSRIDSLEKVISAEEEGLLKVIDNLIMQSSSSVSTATARFLKQVISDRALLRVSKQSAPADSSQVILDLQLALLKKTQQVQELESTKNITGQPTNGSNPDMLTERLEQRETDIAELKDRYLALEQQNGSLQKKLKEVENNASQRNSPAVETPTERPTDTDAALRLAEVDCNLTRADARAIISNSRQRKALLEESLKILNTLSKSSNTRVQQQVKDKMAELNSIANTIRD